MDTSKASRLSKHATLVAVLPPPVTGMSVFTAEVAERLGRLIPLQVINLSDGAKRIGWRFRLRKLCKALLGVLLVLFRSESKGAWLWMPVNARRAMAINLIYAAVARIRGMRVILHHHVYDYLVAHDARVSLLDRVVGERGVHVVHCEQMRDDLAGRYQLRGQTRLLCPEVVGHDRPSAAGPARAAGEPMRLGCISNLSVEKGVPETLELYELLTDRGCPVELTLAGPCVDPALQRRINQVVEGSDGRVRYLGPVYGLEKDRFFREIDVLVFPSRLESWGLVVTEAMSYAKPTIAKAITCLPWIVGEDAGYLVRTDEDFAPKAAEVLQAWHGDHAAYARASAAAARRVVELRRVAEADWDSLAEFLSSGA